jgi:hypothetical protein
MTDMPPTALPEHALARPDMREAIARHDFGTVFALARKWAGISYSKTAEACGIKPDRVGRLARGRGTITTYDKITQIADAFRIPGHMVGLAMRPWEHTTPTTNGGSVQRRDFLKTATVGLGAALEVPTWVAKAPGRIGNDMPRLLRERTARLRRLDDVLGGGETFAIYRREFELTQHLLRNCTIGEQTRKAMLSVLAEQAQQAGWAAFDAGNHGTAIHLYQTSRQAAVQAIDAPLAGNALAFLAYEQVGSNPRAAVATAEESCRIAGLGAPSRVRVLLHERLAWAHAANGNATDAEHELANAEQALAEGDQQPQRHWTSWVDRTELQIMTGRCWTQLRRPLRAVPLLESVLASFDDSHARDKALYLSSLAQAYLAAGEVEQAAAVTQRVLELSAGVASIRPRRHLEPVLEQLTKHRSIAVVADVLDLRQAT